MVNERANHSARTLDQALSDLAGNLGLDFVVELAMQTLRRLWFDPTPAREPAESMVDDQK